MTTRPRPPTRLSLKRTETGYEHDRYEVVKDGGEWAFRYLSADAGDRTWTFVDTLDTFRAYRLGVMVGNWVRFSPDDPEARAWREKLATLARSEDGGEKCDGVRTNSLLGGFSSHDGCCDAVGMYWSDRHTWPGYDKPVPAAEVERYALYGRAWMEANP